ncbi:MAG: universal stress protein [Chloroflexota bacterium]
MYDKLLVALDGSRLAERVLPVVEPLAERFGGTLVLLSAILAPEEVMPAASPVAPGVLPGPALDPQAIVDADRGDATRYLAEVAARLRQRGLAVRVEMPQGPAAAAIVTFARREAVDLIAMTTHGRGGLGRLVFGSVADEVLRQAPCPVLLVRIPEE